MLGTLASFLLLLEEFWGLGTKPWALHTLSMCFSHLVSQQAFLSFLMTSDLNQDDLTASFQYARFFEDFMSQHGSILNLEDGVDNVLINTSYYICVYLHIYVCRHMCMYILSEGHDFFNPLFLSWPGPR